MESESGKTMKAPALKLGGRAVTGVERFIGERIVVLVDPQNSTVLGVSALCPSTNLLQKAKRPLRLAYCCSLKELEPIKIITICNIMMIILKHKMTYVKFFSVHLIIALSRS
jgi:hypothetical protein